MSTFANQLKTEIGRLARKEARAETQPLKKAAAQHRSDVASLRRRVAALEAMVKKLSKGVGRPRAAQAPDAAAAEGDTALRFRASGFASLRKKLDLSAADMARLIGVSGQTIYHWESGKSRPRASQLAAIAAVRKMGKKAVAARLGA